MLSLVQVIWFPVQFCALVLSCCVLWCQRLTSVTIWSELFLNHQIYSLCSWKRLGIHSPSDWSMRKCEILLYSEVCSLWSAFQELPLISTRCLRGTHSHHPLHRHNGLWTTPRAMPATHIVCVRVLYPCILILHQVAPGLKALGDQYLRDKFRRQKTAYAAVLWQ